MEHEVVIQLPAELVQRALEDPVLLARCVPGLSTDAADAGAAPGPVTGAARAAAGAGPGELSGRLRLRIGGSTITYRGVISLIRSGSSGVLTALVEGQEARGDGEVTATVRLGVAPDGPDATVLRFRGDLTPGGRLAEFDAETLAVAGRRLLDRFAAELATEAAHSTEADDGEADDDTTEQDAPTAPPTLSAVPNPTAGEDDGETAGEDDDEMLPDDLFADDLSDLIAFSDPEPFARPAESADPDEATGLDAAGEVEHLEVPYGYPRSAGDLPPGFGRETSPSPEDVLAGPVRRSIVGRSAEEVDHAPPRGRYAPALPARSARARAASRWYGDQGAGAPVAARVSSRISAPWVIGGGVALLGVGGAVVLARALRRR